MLRVSTRGRYGLLAMIELACGYGGRPVQLTSVAEKYNISRKYLHNLMTTLRGAGLVRSERGAQGGFLLTQAPDRISLKQILYTLEGEKGNGHEARRSANNGTIVDDVLSELSDGLKKNLQAISLEHLAQRARKKNGQLMYYI